MCAGAIIAVNAGAHAVVGIFTCWIALFAPGILLIFGVMPWWGVFRNFQVYRRCGGVVRLPGALPFLQTLSQATALLQPYMMPIGFRVVC